VKKRLIFVSRGNRRPSSSRLSLQSRKNYVGAHLGFCGGSSPNYVGARPDDSRVNPGNIVKLKRNMHNGLSIYQTKYCKTTFLALSCLPILHVNQSSSSGKNSIITPEVATNPPIKGGSSRRAAGLRPSLKNVRQKIPPNGQTRLKFGFSYENFTTQSCSVLPTPFRLNVS